jgi:hypothetical protein
MAQREASTPILPGNPGKPWRFIKVTDGNRVMMESAATRVVRACASLQERGHSRFTTPVLRAAGDFFINRLPQKKAIQTLDTCLRGCLFSDTFAQDLFAGIVLWVMDLPASEFHHHGYRGGMLDHMGEVSLGGVLDLGQRLVNPWSSPSHVPLRRAVTFVGATHDAGKLLEMEVRAPDGTVWDPRSEPLAYFKVRHGMPLLEATPVSFVPGRGLDGHEDALMEFVDTFMPPLARRVTRDTTVHCALAYTRRHQGNPTPYPRRIIRAATCVHEADGKSAAAGRGRPGTYLEKLVAQAG